MVRGMRPVCSRPEETKKTNFPDQEGVDLQLWVSSQPAHARGFELSSPRNHESIYHNKSISLYVCNLLILAMVWVSSCYARWYWRAGHLADSPAMRVKPGWVGLVPVSRADGVGFSFSPVETQWEGITREDARPHQTRCAGTRTLPFPRSEPPELRFLFMIRFLLLSKQIAYFCFSGKPWLITCFYTLVTFSDNFL